MTLSPAVSLSLSLPWQPWIFLQHLLMQRGKWLTARVSLNTMSSQIQWKLCLCRYSASQNYRTDPCNGGVLNSCCTSKRDASRVPSPQEVLHFSKTITTTQSGCKSDLWRSLSYFTSKKTHVHLRSAKKKNRNPWAPMTPHGGPLMAWGPSSALHGGPSAPAPGSAPWIRRRTSPQSRTRSRRCFGAPERCPQHPPGGANRAGDSWGVKLVEKKLGDPQTSKIWKQRSWWYVFWWKNWWEELVKRTANLFLNQNDGFLVDCHSFWNTKVQQSKR